MMYFLLILFFASLLSIVFMIGRKLSLVKNGEAIVTPETTFEIPHWDKVKHHTVRGAKKYGHMGLVETLRLYIRFSNFLKEKYEELKVKIKNINTKKDLNGKPVEKAEVNKFLKMISDYKNKIRELKQKIHEEENL